MKQVLYKSDNVSVPGHLPGAYKFPNGATLAHAILQIGPPLAGALTLALEVNGEIVPEHVYSITPGAPELPPAPAGELVIRKALGVEVPAGGMVRWTMTEFTGAPEEGPLPLGITLGYVGAGFASAFVPVPKLEVRWVNGDERFILFDYDPDTGAFTESAEGAGLSAARAVLDGHDGAYFTATIQGTEVLRAQDGVLYVEQLNALGGVGRSQGAMESRPTLDFLIDGRRVAALNKDGVLAVGRVEANESGLAGVTASPRFAFSDVFSDVALLAEPTLYVTRVEAGT